MSKSSFSLLGKFSVMFAVLLLLVGLSAAVTLTTIKPTVTTTTTIEPTFSIVNTTNASSSSSSGLVITPLLTVTGSFVNDAANMMLLSGPYVYVAATPALVIDSTTRKVVSTIKPTEKDSHIDAIAVSPDGKYVYVAVYWSVYESDPYGGYYNAYARIVRLNATTQDPIDYFQFERIKPEHLAVSPDGKVYLGFQQYGYPEDAGIKIMDFNQGKSWYLDYKKTMMMENFAFANGGSKVFYSAYYDSGIVYELDWSANKVYTHALPVNYSDYYQYARSIATALDGKMLYAVMNRNQGIFAMNTQDGNKQVIPTSYIPVALASSPDGTALYVIGYILDSNNNPLYMFHKYGGLKQVGPFPGEKVDYMFSTKETFYTTDSLAYIQKPSGNYPSRISVSGDGRFAYIATARSDTASDPLGDTVLVYDLQYMNQLPNIPAKNSGTDISAANEKILFSPTPDYTWLGQFASNTPKFDSTVIFTKKFYPENGTFAKDYKQEFFELYVSFTEKLDNTTVSNSTFWLTEKNGAKVPGRALSASAIAIFVPHEQLKPDTDYIAYLSKSIKSKDGKPLYADVKWEFTTRNTSGSSVMSNTSLDLSLAKQLQPIQGGTFVIPQLNITMPGQTNQTQPSQNQSTPQPQQNVSQQTNPQQSPAQTQQSPPPESLTQPQSDPNLDMEKINAPDSSIMNQSPSEKPEYIDPSGEATKSGQPSTPGEEISINPQPEPPKPAGLFDSIVNFFKSLFGWK